MDAISNQRTEKTDVSEHWLVELDVKQSEINWNKRQVKFLSNYDVAFLLARQNRMKLVVAKATYLRQALVIE